MSVGLRSMNDPNMQEDLASSSQEAKTEPTEPHSNQILKELQSLSAIDILKILNSSIANSPVKSDEEVRPASDIAGLHHNFDKQLEKLDIKHIVRAASSLPTPAISPSISSSITLPDGRAINIPDSVQFVRLTWVDYTNNHSNSFVPINRFLSTIESPSKGSLTMPSALFHLIPNGATPGYSAAGEWRFFPDLSSLRVCGLDERKYATVMGHFENEDGTEACAYCPRGILKRIVEEAKANNDVEFLVGFESEFILLSAIDPPTPINNAKWCYSSAARPGSLELKVMEEIVQALDVSGIVVEYWHSEGTPGQFEVITGPLPPVQAVDALVLTRETIYNVAAKHGVRATFAPRVFDNALGTAAHTHISVRRGSDTASVAVPSNPNSSVPNRPAIPTPFTSVESSFLQGLLTHLPSTCIFTLPTPSSYDRVKDGIWSGGTWVSWGRNNRECPIRICKNQSGYNFEVRCVDATANPYLAVAALLGAGLTGVKAGQGLEVEECSVKAAFELSDAERVEKKLTKRLPMNLEEARDIFIKENHELSVMLGEDAVSLYLDVNKALAVKLEEMSLPQLIVKY
ncbi:glutamine synthetase/guanido kinase [Sistotremastrum suecicum HHB10207 ss-3]|uniref:Glutamine synthetase/guanido kinase n=1 Tax=Sistotremastrum suecicum HHB10207 ss-3 TaxID=1314776 RepID=A0A166H5K4_9AGAM|nr:glutamine synthetase/guanido kinase [Sistotremastrum suecicum HHB10207 ss-3]